QTMIVTSGAGSRASAGAPRPGSALPENVSVTLRSLPGNTRRAVRIDGATAGLLAYGSPFLPPSRSLRSSGLRQELSAYSGGDSSGFAQRRARPVFPLRLPPRGDSTVAGLLGRAGSGCQRTADDAIRLAVQRAGAAGGYRARGFHRRRLAVPCA